ncbi:MAG TPA: DUF1801 domain-containing protein [Allosphingosinicella sp.]|nr:DUF1801 domain-containing protein [Allosphingosinicella sp.]
MKDRKKGNAGDGFSAEERAAMKARAKELKAGKGDGEADPRAAIAALAEPDRTMAERLDALIKEHAPQLAPRTWYGMPAYTSDGQVLCYFQSASKFKARYATLGFSDKAGLDAGEMWWCSR